MNAKTLGLVVRTVAAWTVTLLLVFPLIWLLRSSGSPPKSRQHCMPPLQVVR